MNPTTPAAAPRRSRRLLVPLATLAAAGALVVGSGASFTSSSANSTSVVTSGSLQQTNSRNGQAIFNVGNIKPGDTVTGSVTITNNGTLPSNMTLTEDATNGFAVKANLTMTITETKTVAGVSSSKLVYGGAFDKTPGALDTFVLDAFQPGEARTYDYVVTLAQGAGNDEQGKSASASYAWAGTQQSASTVNETRTVDSVVVNANPTTKVGG